MYFSIYVYILCLELHTYTHTHTRIVKLESIKSLDVINAISIERVQFEIENQLSYIYPDIL